MKKIIIIGCTIILGAFSIQETPHFPWVQDGQLCYIQPDGTIIPADQTSLRYPDFQHTVSTLKPFEQMGISGFKDTDGPLLNYTFDRCYDFQDGMARVYDKNEAKGYIGFGYIDRVGKVRIPLIYKRAMDFVNGYALVMDDSRAWFLIDKDGKKVHGPNSELRQIEKNIFGK